MPKSQIVWVLALAGSIAGCSSVPSYYTGRVSNAPVPADAYATSATADVETRFAKPAAPRRQASVQTSGEASTPHTVVSQIETTPAIRRPAPDNTGGAAAAAQQDLDLRAERERQRKQAEERRERALKRSMDSICRGC